MLEFPERARVLCRSPPTEAWSSEQCQHGGVGGGRNEEKGKEKMGRERKGREGKKKEEGSLSC